MDSEERVILKELFKNLEGLELYYFHEYKGLSVAQIYKAIQNLLKEKLIIQKKNIVRIDKRRLGSVLKGYPELFCNIVQDWKKEIDYSKISDNLEKELKRFR